MGSAAKQVNRAAHAAYLHTGQSKSKASNRGRRGHVKSAGASARPGKSGGA
jgi:hypothetical protein